MSRIVIGTAGHIDHGKTALVKALTGIDTDRLKEEKRRGITIELGFASLLLPDGTQAAIIDVPGHERFIKNMLAGAAGIDLALLIVAANEGVMPQTREHLEILSLLEIKEVIPVITKIDLVEEDFLALVNEEVQELLKDSSYRETNAIQVSAYTGQGMETLKKQLGDKIGSLPPRQVKEGLTRLPVDRAFKMQGFGTIAAGTLFTGIIRTGDVLEIPGKAAQFKVRSLQVHGRQMQEAKAGQRVAVNLGGLDAGSVERGDVLATPGYLRTSNRLDLSLRLLKSAPRKLSDMSRVRFHQGTKETLGRVFMIGRQALLPGEEGFVQIVLEEPIVTLRGDNYILRSYSPSRTIGGGRIIEPYAVKHKKKQANLLEELIIKSSGNPCRIAAYLLGQSQRPLSMADLLKDLGVPSQAARGCLEALVREGTVIEIKGSEESSIYLASARLEVWEKSISREIDLHLQQFPLTPGLNKEVIRGDIIPDLSTREFNALLKIMAGRHAFKLMDNQYLLPYNYVPQLAKKQAIALEAIKDFYAQKAWQVPDWKTVKEKLDLSEKDAKQLLDFLLRKEELIQLGEDLYLPCSLFLKGREILQTWFQDNQELTVAQFRDLLGTTRRIAVPFLEYLDRLKVTSKKGDLRISGGGLFDRKSTGQV